MNPADRAALRPTCLRCGKPHQAHGGRQRYCSMECYRQATSRTKQGVIMRRYCPVCQRYGVLPGEDMCRWCGAPASRRYPTYVDIGAEHPDAEEVVAQ
jgi:hypothetical protein